MHAEKIVGFKVIGNLPTVDITVDSEDHVFYGNGVVGSNSHAFCYGETALWCAYAKAHFTEEFFCSYLRNSENKSDKKEEVSILVNDAKQFNIEVKSPTILNPNKNFTLDGLSILCGFGNISGIGEKTVELLMESIVKAESELNKKITEFSWYDILLYLCPTTTKTVIQNMILVGAFSHLGIYRKKLLFDYLKFKELDEKDITILKSMKQYTNLVDGLDGLLNSAVESKGKTGSIHYMIGDIKYSAKRIGKLADLFKTMKNPSSELVDDEEFISNCEEKLIGIPMTCMKLDACDVSFGNCTCVEFEKSDMKEFRIAAQISKVGKYTPKQGALEGQVMAYITIADSTGSCEAVAFPKAFADYEYLLFQGNTVGITGKKSSSGSLQIYKAIQL